MESDDKLNENNIKNRTCYYFDDRIRIENFDLDNILIHEKLLKKNSFQTFHIKF